MQVAAPRRRMELPSRTTRTAAIVAAVAVICTLWVLRPDPPAPEPRGEPRAAARAAPSGRAPPAASASLPPSGEQLPPSAQPRGAPPSAPGDEKPGPASPGPLDRAALRFQVRWGEPGLCGPEGAARAAVRAALLARFVPLQGAATPVLHDPAVPPAVLAEVQRSLLLAAERVVARGLQPVTPPTVYVYRDLEQMLSASCANAAAIGYYDCAIHLSGDPHYPLGTVAQTVVHEYVHHLLIHRGIRLPTWLQEGLAMDAARELWWRDGSLGLVAWARDDHLPFQDMVTAFPDTADEQFAAAAYAQSVMMLGFVRARRGDEGIAALVDGLARHEIEEEKAFEWATRLSGGELEDAWREYVGGWSRER